MNRLRVVFLLALTGLLALAGVGTAAAAPTDPFQYKFGFDTAAAGGFEGGTNFAVNHQSGNVLVFERGRVVQFGADGKPVNFSGLGAPSFTPGGGNVMLVDNSGGATQGNIYVIDTQGCCSFGGERFWSFGPDGNPLGTNPIEFDGGGWERLIVGAGVGPDGKLWLFTWNFVGDGSYSAQAVTPTGANIGPKVPIAANGGWTNLMDELGHYFYAGPESYGRSAPETFAAEGETGLPLGEAVAVDPATNDVYSRQGSKIQGVKYSAPLVKAAPFTAIERISSGGPFTFDATGQWLYVAEGTRISAYHREPAAAPSVSATDVDGIRSSRAQVHGVVTANGAATSYHFEYGTDTTYGSSTPSVALPLGFFPLNVEASIEGLQPNTTYHVRLVATNAAGTTNGPDRVLKTYSVQTTSSDPCANALARKQTSAQRLPDCRAYELVSAADTGGYDVESYLAPGQTPYPGFPAASDRVLYATHSGAVPGPWNATNKGPDPYLATRGAGGWTTEYKGLPADLSGAGSFSSVLGEADAGLSTLAFAGPGLCNPCFGGGGLATGIPLRMPNGQLVQGMAGSLDPGVSTAKPEGRVEKMFSADGHHLVFASKYAFEPGANTGGDLTVYDRNLATGTTQIVSTSPGGATLTGPGISELDVSGDGSRIVVGTRVATDAAGNEYVHPYMHLGSSPNSVDLAPLATNGVLFAGMTADGSRAFFTSADKLLPAEDTDTSADLYEAEVDQAGTLHLALVSEKAAPVACSPVANGEYAHWNTPSGAANCDAVAVGGGGGVASSSGAVYFLSPEQLDGSAGTLNQPNLYRAAPGAAPDFVTTLEPGNPLVVNSVKAAATRRTGDFQTTPGGNFGAFVSALELTGVHTFGKLEVFRYEAATGNLVCASCDTTGTTDASLAEGSSLAPDGLSLLEDGRIFFTTRLELVLNDANQRKDVYQWTDGGEQQLITAGAGPFDSGLLTASADGTDVFFFTHEPLAPEEDTNGSLMRIYDAREGGGFFKLPAAVPCQASDECHGPGTVAPPPPDIRSAGRTTHGNFVSCKKNQVKRGDKCVKKPKKKRHKKQSQKQNQKQGKGKQGKGSRHA